MDCCQIQGIEEVFSHPLVDKELKRYRDKGPIKTTRMLIAALQDENVHGLTLLDIGGGVGAIQHALLGAGVQQAIDVDASATYLEASRSEAQRRGLAERITYRHGDFVDLASGIPDADVVTLDRVICCYDDMERLVNLSAAKAKARYGLVYPRDTWWLKALMWIGNKFLRLRKSSYRMFLHPTQVVEEILKRNGLEKRYDHHTLIWQVAVYSH